MITVTDIAAGKLIEQITNIDGSIGIRVGVLGGGCSGFQYHLDFAMVEHADDTIYESKGVSLYVDQKSDMLLNDVVIDYSSDLMQSGFKFINPAASRTCGCGESFSC
jgi:iron-sulfur cluster assembly protein